MPCSMIMTVSFRTIERLGNFSLANISDCFVCYWILVYIRLSFLLFRAKGCTVVCVFLTSSQDVNSVLIDPKRVNASILCSRVPRGGQTPRTHVTPTSQLSRGIFLHGGHTEINWAVHAFFFRC